MLIFTALLEVLSAVCPLPLLRVRRGVTFPAYVGKQARGHVGPFCPQFLLLKCCFPSSSPPYPLPPSPGLHGEIMSKRYLELLGGRGQTVSDQR